MSHSVSHVTERPVRHANGAAAPAGVAAMLAAYVLLALLAAYVLPAGPRSVVLVAAPLGAGLAAAAAWVRLPRNAGRTWTLIAAGSLAGAAARLGTGAGTTDQLLAGVAVALVTLGLAWALHERDHGRVLEIVADTALVVGAATVMAMRWAPQPAEGGPLADAAALVPPVAFLCVLLYAAVLAAVQRSACALAAAGGAVLLGVAQAPLPYGGDVLLQVTGWGLLAAAAVHTAGRGAAASLAPAGSRGGAALRLVVAPTVALGMGGVVVHAGLGAPLSQATGLGLGLLGALLALRVSQLLSDTRSLPQERSQLAQSQALVEVSAALAGAEDLDETLQRVASWTCRLLRAHAAGIELLTEDGRFLELRASEGITASALGLRFPVEESFTGSVVRSGQVRTTSDPAAEPSILVESRQVLGRSPMAAAPLRFQDRVLGVLSCVAPHPFDRQDLALLEALAGQAAVAIENARLLDQARTLSITDPLTGLANRRQLDRDMAREFAAARRGRRLTAVLFDLDGFKEYNDRHGHLAGDDALRTFARVLELETRAMNLAARWGGDEFVALLTDTDQEGARIFVERVRDHLQREAEDKRLGVSAGIATFDATMAGPSDLIGAADAALYAAKNRSRAG